MNKPEFVQPSIYLSKTKAVNANKKYLEELKAWKEAQKENNK